MGTLYGVALTGLQKKGYECSVKKSKNGNNGGPNDMENSSNVTKAHFGRIISFGKDVAELHPLEIERIDFRVRFIVNQFLTIIYIAQ